MNDKIIILAVDRNKRNVELLSQYFEPEGYLIRGANKLVDFDASLNSGDKISLVLLDIAGFGREVWDRCEKLRTDGVPFLVISPRQSAEVQRTSITHGARGYLVKPLIIKELLSLVRSLTE